MIRLRLSYQCFNGENNTKSIKVVSGIYKNVPVNLEFRLPDGSPFVPEQQLMLDDDGKAEYLIPRELLYQNGTVLTQASIELSDGKVEKSSVVSFPINCSINSHDDFSILLYNNRLYPKGGNKLRLVGDNDCYKIRFVGVENIGEVFAIFSRDNKTSKPILLNEDNSVNIPLWVLKRGSFELGLYAEGFASTPLEIIVDESIVEQSGVIVDEFEPSLAEQLLNKVNNIKYIKSCQIINGKLIVILNDDSEIDAGYVVGGSVALNIQSDWDQNESLQSDYIRNRTHYKETDGEGNIIYHRLDNHYLNLDREVTSDSDNPIMSSAVSKTINEVNEKIEKISKLHSDNLEAVEKLEIKLRDNYYSKNEVNAIAIGVITPTGVVSSVSDLKEVASPQVGDIYRVDDINKNYGFDGTNWQAVVSNAEILNMLSPLEYSTTWGTFANN